MPAAELLTVLAEIAGVFIGFGALISIRSDSATDDYEVTMVRWIVWTGLIVVITALFPVILGEYGIDEHRLWVVSSGLFLLLWWVGNWVTERLNPERAAYVASVPRRVRVRNELPAVVLWLPMNICLVLILLATSPDHEAALYVTAVALNLIMDALLLLYLVFRQGSPESLRRAAHTHGDKQEAVTS